MRSVFTRSMAVILAAWGWCAVSPAWALSVTPFLAEITASGKTSIQLLVQNTSPRKAAIELAVYKLEMDEVGGQITTETTDITVFPAQSLIEVGKSQTFRVMWNGRPLQKGESYQVTVSEVPVKMPGASSGMQLVTSFAVTILVNPAQGTSALNVVSTDIARRNNKAHPAVVVANTGNKHAAFTNHTIVVSDGAWSQTLTPTELRRALGVGLVQPGKRRRFELPLDLPSSVRKPVIVLDAVAQR